MKRIISFSVLVFGFVLQSHAQVSRVGVKENWSTDLSRTTISLYEFEALTPRSAFQSIDNPRFYNEETSKEYYDANENVVVVSAGREYKAYPLEFLIFHQVINDRIGGVPIAVTYCPFTDAVIVYERRFTHRGVQRELLLKPSGMIRKSNIVLYDQQTESWWQQYNGTAKVGHFLGTELKQVCSLRMTMKDFYENCKYGLVIKDNVKDELLPYGINPYYKYDNVLTEKPLYLNYMPSEKLMPMETVLLVDLRGNNIIYPLEDLQQRKVLNDLPMDMYVVVFYEANSTSMLGGREIKTNDKQGSMAAYSSFHDGRLLTFSSEGNHFIDEQTKSIWNFNGLCIDGSLKGQQLKQLMSKQSFAFVALDFYRNSLIYNINW
ncbi:DUF3179 domain-containing (seleno)protein [Flammeovirga kamogawensis]|uniref:DUF3179 domain-containing protein n=1 Tax=Flammeovirga kamogawensis TaxID=373891 RepID=A0ABX8GUK0_9BACT|nr:DUF3179 domain-containing (seleno)protein [Flammeovirga kamogawensis]MBB6459990.1 hypothetical protein [Flammeovirga kamogawensis]QWG06962.1 DUF3179 domain-containing protein [Flammeovirga kamogawensis]TRX68782.1 DUF3179 domain-containing protein [Flammeovirga kamogawensis]